MKFERLGIFVSILVHFFIIYFFVFYFPIRSVAHKPPFIFLGSILENQDVAIFSSDPYNPHGENVSVGFSILRQNSRFDTIHTMAVVKPNYDNMLGYYQKIDKKTTFLGESDNAFDRRNFARRMGISPTPPGYIPLKLHK